MHIKYFTESYREQWNEWVFSNPNTTFYHRIEWKDVIEKSFNHKTFYILAIEDNCVHGVLPLVQLKSILFGNIFCSMPFLNFGGISASSESAYQLLLNECNEILRKENADYIEFRHLQKSPVDLIRNEHKVSMTVALEADPGVLWDKFKTKHRTNIRRAKKNGLEIVCGGEEYLEEFYRILSTGWRNLGTPIYRIDFFKNILNIFGDRVEIYLVYYDGQAIATAFNGLFNDTVEGMWTYSLREYAKLQTNYFLYWQMIKDACERNFRLFHLGRSTNASGATFFKSKWNAELHQLYWEYLLNEKKCSEMPKLNVNNPKYKMAINVWKKLPVMITNQVGPQIAKNIP